MYKEINRHYRLHVDVLVSFLRYFEVKSLLFSNSKTKTKKKTHVYLYYLRELFQHTKLLFQIWISFLLNFYYFIIIFDLSIVIVNNPQGNQIMMINKIGTRSFYIWGNRVLFIYMFDLKFESISNSTMLIFFSLCLY